MGDPSGSFTMNLSPGDVEALRRWADAYTGAPPRLNRCERRAAARRERRGIGAWRAALHQEADRALCACAGRPRSVRRTRAAWLADRVIEALSNVWDLPPRDNRPLSEWMRAHPGVPHG